MKSTISRQLPLILAEEKVETELKNIPIKEPGLTFKSDKKRFEIQATFCDLGLMPNAEFRVKLKVPNDGSDTDYYWFMDSSDDEPENINGPVIKGVDKSAEGWVERLKDKVNDPESQVIVTLDAYVASGIDCEKVSSEMLAIAPAEPDAAS